MSTGSTAVRRMRQPTTTHPPALPAITTFVQSSRSSNGGFGHRLGGYRGYRTDLLTEHASDFTRFIDCDGVERGDEAGFVRTDADTRPAFDARLPVDMKLHRLFAWHGAGLLISCGIPRWDGNIRGGSRTACC